jgi:hypothetical protein
LFRRSAIRFREFAQLSCGLSIPYARGFEFTGPERALPEDLKGATRILEQGAHQFDVLDLASDFSKNRLLILPAHVPVFGELAQKLEHYVARGGSVIASFASGMDEAETRFNTDLFGVTVIHPGPRDLNGNLVRGKAFEHQTIANTPSRKALSAAACRKMNTPCNGGAWPSGPRRRKCLLQWWVFVLRQNLSSFLFPSADAFLGQGGSTGYRPQRALHRIFKSNL